MTINKSQGQSFDKVGLYYKKQFFAHGQLYVLLSRCKVPKNSFIQNESDDKDCIKNVVWDEIFDEL